MDSPVSNNGRGLKLVDFDPRPANDRDSPVSNNGRGLKLFGELDRVGGGGRFAR